MTIAAAMVGVTGKATMGAPLAMASQGSRTTRADRMDGFELRRPQVVVAQVSIAIAIEYVRQFDPIACRRLWSGDHGYSLKS